MYTIVLPADTTKYTKKLCVLCVVYYNEYNPQKMERMRNSRTKRKSPTRLRVLAHNQHNFITLSTSTTGTGSALLQMYRREERFGTILDPLFRGVLFDSIGADY